MKCFFFLVGYSLGGGSGRVRALNLTVPLGSGRVGSDNFGYGPGSGFSFEPRADLYHTPATGGEEKRVIEPIKWMRSPHTSYRWRGQRVIEPIKWMLSPHTPATGGEERET